MSFEDIPLNLLDRIVSIHDRQEWIAEWLRENPLADHKERIAAIAIYMRLGEEYDKLSKLESRYLMKGYT